MPFIGPFYSELMFPFFFGSQELRELEARLKSAYMNKERSAQLAEKEAEKVDDMVSFHEIDLVLSVCVIHHL